MNRTLLPTARIWIAVAALFVAAGAILLAMGRTPICECGVVRLWHGVVQSPENSQQLSDWYSPSHLIHGLLFYGAAWLLWFKWRVLPARTAHWALPLAVLVEAAWEILENSPVIIDRYRAVTVSWGYTGDSVINSLSDIAFMVLGFLLAARIPVWASVALALFLEAFTLWAIRDNLTLNVIMLVWPLDAIRQWQAGA